MAKSFSTADIKARLSEMISKVVYGRERVVVLRRGKPVAALVSLEDLQRLESLDSSNQEALAAHPITRAFGGWADRDDLDALVTEINSAREAATGREVEL
jgi:prevent-host-death family protein